METLIQPFLDYLHFEKRYSQHTIRSYGDDLRDFFAFVKDRFGLLTLADISSPLVRSWLASLKEDKLASKSINRKISSLKSFFKYQLRSAALTQSPMGNIISPKSSKRLPVYVEQKDIHTLFTNVTFEPTWKGRTDRLLLAVFYQTGMRLSELINLKESQVDQGNRALKVLGKGNKERIIPIGAPLAAELAAYALDKRTCFEKADLVYLLVSDKGRKLYPKSVYLTVHRYLGDITTLDKKSPHVLRHTFATHLTNGGADLNSVKELLGHSSLAATQVYTHNSIEKLKEIHKRAHPKA